MGRRTGTVDEEDRGERDGARLRKKKLEETGNPVKKAMVNPALTLSIRKQCTLLSYHRSTYYYESRPVSDRDVQLMNRIDEIFTGSPEYGSRFIRKILWRVDRVRVNRKRIVRLMRKMGICAIYPGPNTSLPGKGLHHQVHPYLLRGLQITRPNHVWNTDITYIRMKHGFLYLVAVMDWGTRRILSWEISQTMDAEFCISALRRALAQWGTPEIFNTDQGVQFTSHDFQLVLKERNIRISMDGKGRAIDNIAIERFWGTLKRAEVYLNEYHSPIDAYRGISRYIKKYNSERPHSALGDFTPDEAYFGQEYLLKEA